MTSQVIRQWDDSPVVAIPAAVMEAAHLKLNQAVQVRAENGRIIVEPAAQELTLDVLLAGITPENRHQEIDIGPPVGREFT
ncbi:MAG: PbsX family transcriptional regulator [Candidatus Competibacteraceae bacterium]|nr:MAG: PbsX family transcriptional regulator [Candidatus Competibacteraceae bacterium]